MAAAQVRRDAEMAIGQAQRAAAEAQRSMGLVRTQSTKSGNGFYYGAGAIGLAAAAAGAVYYKKK